MERASSRQVHHAARILGRHAKQDRLYQLSYNARTFVTTNSRSHTVSISKLSSLPKEEMDRLLRDLKG